MAANAKDSSKGSKKRATKPTPKTKPRKKAAARGAAVTSTSTSTSESSTARSPERAKRELTVQLRRPAGANGRGAERKPWTARVNLLGGQSAPLTQAQTTNLSEGGVFVETPVLLDVGDPVLLTFRDPAGEALKVSGRVRWATPFGTLDDPRPGMGIEFTGLDATRRRRVEAMFERLPDKAPLTSG